MFEPRLLGHVSTEGGPLLIADRAAIANWAGADGGGYAELCDALLASETRALPISLDGSLGLAWDVQTGTTHIWRMGPSSVLLTRAWVDQLGDLPRLAKQAMDDGDAFGPVTISSGWLVVVWAPEPGHSVLAAEPSDGLSLDLSVGSAGLLIAMPTGNYEASGDEVDVDNASALRCLIRPRDI